jgi:hypothetical protein
MTHQFHHPDQQVVPPPPSTPPAGYTVPQQPHYAWMPPPGVVWPPAQAAVEPKNGFGIASFAMACGGALVGLIPILGIIAMGLGIAALTLGVANLGRLNRRTATNPVLTWLGISISVVATTMGLVGVAQIAALVS